MPIRCWPLLLALVLGCTVTNRASDTAASPTVDPPPLGTATTSGDVDNLAAVSCSTNAECGEGVCEGEGCGEMLGKCAPKERMCTRDLQTYCGCDDVEFRASGSCPNARFAHRGQCERAKPKPDGIPCASGPECQSGVCEGEGCDVPGVCMPANRACTRDSREYCGCDGATFRGSGTCPGARFVKRGPC